MFSFQENIFHKKIIRYTKKQESMVHSNEKVESKETALEKDLIAVVLNKDFKISS